MKDLEALRKTCPGESEDHQHAPWGLSRVKGEWQFATAEECEYPKELCDKIAEIVKAATQAPPAARPPDGRKQKSKHGKMQAAERAAVGRQSRRHGRPNAIPDRRPPTSFVVTEKAAADEPKASIGNVRETTRIGGVVLPAGTKIISVVEQRPVGKDGLNHDKEWACNVAHPWSEEEFFTRATRLPHPMDEEPVLPDRTKLAIFDILTMGRQRWAESKVQALASIQKRADALASREADIKNELPEAVRKVNHKKNILLMTELLDQMKYADKDVAFRCYTGFPIVGKLAKVPVFEQRPQRRSSSEQTRCGSAG